MPSLWKPVSGYEGLYEVSDAGEVTSVRNEVFYLRAPFPNKMGYLRVALWKDGRARNFYVHRLVLGAFDPRPEEDSLQANHKNGVVSDNRLSNLSWVTMSENMKHSYAELGRRFYTEGRRGAELPWSRPVVGLSPDGFEIRFESIACAGRAGFTAPAISQCLSGRRKSHKGLKWRYDASKVSPV
ncbi:MAG: HNH endonuclease [Desulfurellales bacterium]|nr:MAG: HNH endonuclease [Desulfurellales bacterium]